MNNSDCGPRARRRELATRPCHPRRCHPSRVSYGTSPDEDFGVGKLFAEQPRWGGIVQQVTQIDFELLETSAKQMWRRARQGIDPGHDVIDASHLRTSSR